MLITKTLNTSGDNLAISIAPVIIFCVYGSGLHVMLRVILTLNNLVISADNFSPVPPWRFQMLTVTEKNTEASNSNSLKPVMIYLSAKKHNIKFHILSLLSTAS